MNTSPLEADTRILIDKSLENLGWKFTGKDKNVFFEQPKTEEERKKLQGKRPDYVLYSKENDQQPLIIIEAKKKGERIDTALEQGIHYAKQLGAPIVFATDGLFCKAYHTKFHKTPILNGEEVDEFIRETLALKYLTAWEVNTVSPKVQYDRKELIKIFDEANNMLRGDGLRAGIERFGEFANILFLKLISESEDIKKLSGKKSEFDDMCHWDYIKNLKANSRIEHINKIVYEKLNALYKTDIFTPLSIRDPSILKEIMDKLSPLTLTDVDSDVKGDAFEYFLKESTATKNDLGEYFTPRHIVKTMVKLVNPQIGEKIYDPFCGTGGFLIESFRHIWNTMPRNENTEKILREETIYGNEITNTARITKMNMILAGDGHSNIHMSDSLANPVDGQYDVVIANMPYSQKTKYGSLYDLPSSNGDSICVQHCLKAINAASENGRVALVVPEGFLFRKDLAKTRELLLKVCNLQSIISLPQGVFLPYTGVKTNIIYATKINQKLSVKEKRKDYWYFDIKSDGYSLDNHRRKLDSGSDLDKYQEYRKLNRDQQQEMLDIGFEIIPLDKVRENSFNLVGSRYREAKHIKSKFQILRLGDIAKFENGFAFSTSQWTDNGYKIIRIQNLTGSSNEYNHIVPSNELQKYVVKENDLLVSWSGTLGFYLWKGNDSYLNQHIFNVKNNENIIIKKYLFYLGPRIVDDMQKLVHGGTMKHITKEYFEDIRIPVPPVNVQQQIIEELEGYHQITHGAKTVIDNYKSNILIKDDWELKPIGELCTLTTGSTPSTKDRENYDNGTIKWVVSGDVHLGKIFDCHGRLTEKGKESARLKMHPIDSVLIALNGQGKTRGTVALLKTEATCNQSIVSMNPIDTKKLMPEFLYYILKCKYQEIREITGDKQRSGLNMPIIRNIHIPLPPLEIQNQIVAKIEDERALIEPSKQLVEVFTKKIKERINELFQ